MQEACLAALKRTKKAYESGLPWPSSSPLNPGDALAASRVDARRLLRAPPLAVSHYPYVLTDPLAVATAARGT